MIAMALLSHFMDIYTINGIQWLQCHYYLILWISILWMYTMIAMSLLSHVMDIYTMDRKQCSQCHFNLISWRSSAPPSAARGITCIQRTTREQSPDLDGGSNECSGWRRSPSLLIAINMNSFVHFDSTIIMFYGWIYSKENARRTVAWIEKFKRNIVFGNIARKLIASFLRET